VDGELYFPQAWFSDAREADRERLGIPADREFQTKIQLGWQMIQRVKQGPLRFKAVLCDALYGQAEWFRKALDDANILYLAEVPRDTLVYLTPPRQVGDRWEGKAVAVGDLRRRLTFQRVRVRATERGDLSDGFALQQVWVLRAQELVQEWLAGCTEHLQQQAGRFPPGEFALLAHCTEKTNAPGSIKDWQKVFASLGQTLHILTTFSPLECLPLPQ
jgi:hypothetical protein